MPIASAQYDDDEKLAMERAERTAALLGTHGALRRIFSDTDRAMRWIGAPNEAFDGASALDVMLADGLKRKST